MVDPTNPFVQANTLDNSAVKPSGFGDTTKFSTKTSNPSPAAPPPPPIPTDPKGFQQYLNDHGANPPLKVDGIVGPKTLAAAQKLNIAVPPNLAPATPTASTPAPATPAPAAAPGPQPQVQTAAETVTPLPTLTAEQIRAQYGYLGALLDSPDIAVLIAAKAADPSMDDATFLSRLYATPTWQTTSTSMRNYIGLQSTDPAGLQNEIDQQKASVLHQAQQLGITIDPDRLTQIATDSIKLGWTATQLQNAVSSEFHYKPGGQAGQVGVAEANLKQTAAQYMVPVSDQTLAEWDQQIAAGTATADTFKQWFVDQASTLYPTLAPQLAKGLTTDRLVDPYRQVAAQELGINPDSVDFSQPQWKRSINSIDPTTGQPGLMGLADWQKTIRSDPTYRWGYTKNGIDAAYQFANSFLSAVDKVPA